MDAAVLAIQQCYPQVFHACHVAHRRARSDRQRLSEGDGAVLAHIGAGTSPAARDLARHLGVGAPAMSATLQRLERLGYVTRQPRTKQRPTRTLALTDAGREAMQATSVLDRERLELLLAELTPRERSRAVAGLQLLARAAATMPRGRGKA